MSIAVMRAVLPLQGLTAAEKSVLVMLAMHAHDDGTKAYPGVNLLAVETCLSERHVKRALGALKERGLISVLTEGGGRGRITQYQINMNGEAMSPITAKAKGEEDAGNVPGSHLFQAEIVTPRHQSKSETVTSETRNGDVVSRNGDIAAAHIRKNHRKDKKDNLLEQAREVFAYWQLRCRHPRAIWAPDKEKVITARLRQGFTVEECKQAVDGCLASAFHQGENREGKTHDSIKVIFRDSTQVENFIGNVAAKVTPRATSPPLRRCAKCAESEGWVPVDPALPLGAVRPCECQKETNVSSTANHTAGAQSAAQRGF